MKKNLPH